MDYTHGIKLKRKKMVTEFPKLQEFHVLHDGEGGPHAAPWWHIPPKGVTKA